MGKIPTTARQLDKACQRGDFCYVGNRQRILGAEWKLPDRGEAAPGHAWVCMAGTHEWTQVKLSTVMIEERDGGDMPLKGKRENGRPTHVETPKKGAPKQKNLPGVEQEKIPAIERAAKKYNELKEPFQVARDNLTSAKDTLIKMMHDKVKKNADGELVYKRGDVKIIIKPAKESLKVVIGDDDDDDIEITEGED